MFVKLIIRLSALSMGLSYAGCTTPQQQSQLATLHERMNQMISALYSSPLLSKVQTAATSSEEFPSTTSPQESTYSYPPAPAPAPTPHLVFLAPPTFLDPGAQPTDYGHPATTHPVQRSTWSYPFDYYSSPALPPPVYAPPTYSRPQYPEYARPAYPQLSAPQPPPLAPSVPYPPSLSYPSPFPPNMTPFPVPVYTPAFPGASSPPIPYPPQISYPPPHPAPVPCVPTYSPPPPPYPPPVPHQYAPSLHYPPALPVPYPSSITIPYSIPYMQPMYSPPAAFPKPSEMQPQYEYSS